MSRILKFVGLIVVAIIGALILRSLFIAASHPAAAGTQAMARIRAAAADLPDGLLLRDSDLIWKNVPSAQVPAGALVEGAAAADGADNDLKGDLLRHAVHAGTPLGLADVITPNAPGFLAAALKPGMRAISVAIDDVSGNAGLIQPGDYVDVLLTQTLGDAAKDTRAAGRGVESETVVNRVRVLAVGSAFQRPKENAAQPDTRARTVTFEVTPRTAQMIAVATHLGTLSLALRSFATQDRSEPPAADTEPQTPPVWGEDVSRALRSADINTKHGGANGHSAVPSVIIYRGSRSSAESGAASGTPSGAPAHAAAVAVVVGGITNMPARMPKLPPLPFSGLSVFAFLRARRRLTSRIIAGMVIACGCTSLTLTCAYAADTDPNLTVPAGTGEMVKLSEPAVAVFVANPDVADVHVPTHQTVFVFGKKAGTTTLFALGPNNRTILRETITVSVDIKSVQRMLDARFPQLHLTLTSAPGSMMIAGSVPSAADADAVVQSLTPYLLNKETLINRLTLDHPIQVNLRVRITEVDRNITQQLGINWSSLGSAGNFVGGLFNGRALVDTTGAFQLSTTGAFSALAGFRTGKVNIEAVIDALDQEGLMTMLAEPNLTAMSGQTASFLAGGEFPVPVAQDKTGAITVAFKPFGVSLDFTPTVLADNRISLKVRPEVSQIDPSNSVTLSSIKIPALTVRRVETTVELSSGQSFALGGLLQGNTSNILSQFPGLGSLPIIGKLFSSKNYQNNKTEIVIIVTPYIVQPVNPGQLRQPIDSVTHTGSDVEYVLQRSLGIDPLSGSAPRLVGAAGFVY
ncbi:MAG: cpaB [Herbaspirillum sp.]|nr:cpaB [Herbaspirillum sp.]